MDVIVIGAGVIGAATARSLTMAGLGVTVVERGAVGGGTSSAGEGNLLVSDKGPGPELTLALHAALRWPAVAAELAEELGDGFPSIEFDGKGGLVVTTTAEGAELLLRFAASQRAAGVEATVVDVAEALRLEPHLNPAVTAAVHYPQDAQVQPLVVTEALLASARRRGATVLQSTPVLGGVRSADGRLVGVLTPDGELLADAVVLAAGPWSGEVSAALGAPLPVRPRRGVVLVTSRMPPRVFHKVYDGDYVGAVGSGDAGLQTSSVVEATEAGTVLIGSSRQLVGFDAALRVAVLEQVAAKALRLFPFLAGATVLRAYGGFRPFVPDHLPVIGADHRLPGLWHATGHEGAGIGLSVVTAELLTALITGSSPQLDPAPFAPARDSLAPYLATAA